MTFIKKKPKKTNQPKTEKNPNGAGVDKLPVDYAKVRDLARFMFTDEELAVALGCCAKTLQRRRQDDPEFVKAVEEGHANGRKSLRASQFASAIQKGNTTMLIWLGKQYLGQKDTVSNEITGKDGGAIDITDSKTALLRGVVRNPADE